MATVLKALLQQRHLQTVSSFNREYDRLAGLVEPELIGCGPKKAQFYRWLSGDLTGLPYPHHCRILQAMFPDWSIGDLFEQFCGQERGSGTGTAEVITVYPHRSSVPPDLWNRLLSACVHHIDILVLAGLFLAEDPVFVKLVKSKAQQGVSVRILFGDPLADEAARRSAEERLAAGAVQARIRNALALVESLNTVDGVDLRFHRTTLYNSVFRFDDEMIVNTHVFGMPGAYAPALHLRRLPAGDMFETYSTSFEHVWAASEVANFSRIRA
ncbi:XRE family transcriptional regulator [Nocardia sp. NPDC127526]|uniref:XRE family transcriptional regulator n=1 Tax=Nocardia sp. NPDC127526 TaxID=3345393 RepID=UPI003629B26A